MGVRALSNRKKEVDVVKADARALTSIIKKGVQLKARLKATKEGIEKNNARLIPFAEGLCESTGLEIAVFKSEDGVATTSFGNKIKYDMDDVALIKDILGPVFAQFFHEVPSFAVSIEDIPEIKELLGTEFDRFVVSQSSFKHTTELKKLLVDGDSAQAKKVRELVSVVPNNPSVKFENNPG